MGQLGVRPVQLGDGRATAGPADQAGRRQDSREGGRHRLWRIHLHGPQWYDTIQTLLGSKAHSIHFSLPPRKSRPVCLGLRDTGQGPRVGALLQTHADSHRPIWTQRIRVMQALYLCVPFLSKKENVHLFSSSLPRFYKCHETSRIFLRTEQTFARARSFGVIS